MTIWYQDQKERLVSFFLFPFLALETAVIHYLNTTSEVFVTNVLVNIVIICLIVVILFLYARFKMKKNLFKEAFGLGDAFILVALAFAFPVYTFVVLLSLGFLTILGIHFLLGILGKRRETIPFAGELALFMTLVYVASWNINTVNLYYI